MSNDNTNDDKALLDLEKSLISMSDSGVDFDSKEPVSIEGKSETETVNKEQDSEKTVEDKTDVSKTDVETLEDTKASETTETDKQEQTKPSGKPDKRASEEERKSRTWKSIQEERTNQKKEFEQEKASLAEFRKQQQDEINKQLEQIKAMREELDARKAEDEFKGSPEQYEQIAKDAEKRGDTNLAERAKEQAQYLRSKADEKSRFEAEKKSRIDANERQRWIAEAVKEVPELNDTNSPYHKEAIDLMAKNKDLAALPRGPWFAAQFVKMRKELVNEKAVSAKVSTLEKEKSELQTQLAELKKKLSPSTASSSTPLTKPVAQQMSETEMEKFLAESFAS